jgi:hypothetical protein
MTQEEAQQLLNNSVEVGGSRFNVLGEYCFQAKCDNTAEMRWHGFPIKWSDLPTEAKNQLIANGQLTKTEYLKRLRKSARGKLAT